MGESIHVRGSNVQHSNIGGHRNVINDSSIGQGLPLKDRDDELLLSIRDAIAQLRIAIEESPGPQAEREALTRELSELDSSLEEEGGKKVANHLGRVLMLASPMDLTLKVAQLADLVYRWVG